MEWLRLLVAVDRQGNLGAEYGLIVLAADGG